MGSQVSGGTQGSGSPGWCKIVLKATGPSSSVLKFKATKRIETVQQSATLFAAPLVVTTSLHQIQGGGTLSFDLKGPTQLYDIYGTMRPRHSDTSIKFTPDTRSVTLTRANAINERPSVNSGVPVTYGDTIYSHYSERMYNPPETRAKDELTGIIFFSSLPGDWSSDVTKNWVAGDGFLPPNANDLETGSTLHRTIKFGGQGKTYLSPDDGYWVGKTDAGPETVTIKYFARDNADQSEAEARYVLTIHDPIEVDHDDTQPMWAYTPAWGSYTNTDPHGVYVVPGPQSANGSNNPSVTFTHSKGQGTARVVSGELGFEEVGVAIGFSREWSEDTSTGVEYTTTLNIDVDEGYFTYPQYEDEYIRHDVYFRHFMAEGEHKLVEEFPLGSGYYDDLFHNCIFDEPTGNGRVMWAPQQPYQTGTIPPYGTPIEPIPTQSGGAS